MFGMSLTFPSLLRRRRRDVPSPVSEGIRVRGFYRVRIRNEDGTIEGDSGWLENQVTNLGFLWYLAGSLGAVATSSQVSYMALGSGTVPGAAATSLDGEVESRTAVTAATSADSKGVRFTATFGSAGSFVTNTQSLSNIGLFRSATVGTLFAGNTFASSACAINQNVEATYDITFS